jgi:Predicted acyltransferases
MKEHHLKYRPDIDGLRAVAVLAVIFFHLDYSMFKGGYIGVDVFFVISGFLISQIIYPKIQNNNFSFLSFYKNRVLRILPVLFVLIMFV